MSEYFCCGGMFIFNVYVMFVAYCFFDRVGVSNVGAYLSVVVRFGVYVDVNVGVMMVSVVCIDGYFEFSDIIWDNDVLVFMFSFFVDVVSYSFVVLVWNLVDINVG